MRAVLTSIQPLKIIFFSSPSTNVLYIRNSLKNDHLSLSSLFKIVLTPTAIVCRELVISYESFGYNSTAATIL